MPADFCAAAKLAESAAQSSRTLRERPEGNPLHQHHAASLGEPVLAATALAVQKLQQFLAQHFFTEQVGQSNNGLLRCTDAFHHIGPLAHELAQFLMRRPHYLLHVWIIAAGRPLLPPPLLSFRPMSMTCPSTEHPSSVCESSRTPVLCHTIPCPLLRDHSADSSIKSESISRFRRSFNLQLALVLCRLRRQ